MIYKSPIKLVVMIIVLAIIGIVTASVAQADNPTLTAITTIETNLRTGPARTYDTLTILATNTSVIVEGRSEDAQWLLVHLPDNSARGWAIRKLLQLNASIKVNSLPVFTVTTAGTPGVSKQPTPAFTAVPPIDPNTNTDGPIIPDLSGGVVAHIQAIYDKGKALGNNPHVFSKLGDCMTYRWNFLNVFGYGQYNLGTHTDLQEIINYFNTPVRPGVTSSWVEASLAAANGFNSAAILDPEWSDPKLCKVNEAPITCEYRISKPSYAIIMFGASDVYVMTGWQFDAFMHEIIDISEKAGVVPILSTFPENPSVPDKSHVLNQIVYQIARERALPVMNFYAAVKGLPNHGLETDNIHLTLPPGDKSGYFTTENLQYGYTQRNLVVLEALKKVVGSIRH